MTAQAYLIIFVIGIVIGLIIGKASKMDKVERYYPLSLNGERSKPTPPPPVKEKHHFTVRLFRDGE